MILTFNLALDEFRRPSRGGDRLQGCPAKPFGTFLPQWELVHRIRRTFHEVDPPLVPGHTWGYGGPDTQSETSYGIDEPPAIINDRLARVHIAREQAERA